MDYLGCRRVSQKKSSLGLQGADGLGLGFPDLGNKQTK